MKSDNKSLQVHQKERDNEINLGMIKKKKIALDSDDILLQLEQNPKLKSFMIKIEQKLKSYLVELHNEVAIMNYEDWLTDDQGGYNDYLLNETLAVNVMMNKIFLKLQLVGNLKELDNSIAMDWLDWDIDQKLRKLGYSRAVRSRRKLAYVKNPILLNNCEGTCEVIEIIRDSQKCVINKYRHWSNGVEPVVPLLEELVAILECMDQEKLRKFEGEKND